jgi:aspartyl protease family protein
MSGKMGSKALLVVDGGQPKALAAGESHQGVKVIQVQDDRVVVEVQGERETITMGGVPTIIMGGSSGPSGTEIVLAAGEGGHFLTQGTINGRSTRFMVDTGATSVAISADEARRLGIKYEHGETMYGSTANGMVKGYRIRLNSVRIQNVEVFDVEAAVLPLPMPYILLGNSYLTRFQMNRHNDMLRLTRRF